MNVTQHNEDVTAQVGVEDKVAFELRAHVRSRKGHLHRTFPVSLSADEDLRMRQKCPVHLNFSAM